mmetsp:Transcript_49214/g.111641  ORF Transcript_49214/g.111641 Transcript_49214/m.111641 type:complete len:136 (+) Transcript_49214:176-583(+)
MSSLSAAAEKPPDAGVQKGAIAAAMVADSFAMKFAKFIDKTTNGRGIPTVKFLADVEKFMGENKLTIEETIGAYSEMLQMFKLMEGSMTRQKASLKLKVRECNQMMPPPEAGNLSARALLSDAGHREHTRAGAFA